MADDFPGIFNSRNRANKSSEEMYPSQSGVDDQRDASRHMLAAGYLAKSYSPKIAEFLGEMNEKPNLVETLSRLFGKYSPNYGYEMDSHNNRVGVKLAGESKDLADFERLVNLAAEKSHGIPIEGEALVLPAERDRLRYMDKYADGGQVQGYNQADIDARVAQLRAEFAF